MSRFERHIFICTNERPADNPRGCCAASGAAKVVEAFKAELTQRGLRGRMRANKAGCLDNCARGVSVVVYPEGVWYGGVQPQDVAEIVEKHLIQGEPVARLQLKEGSFRNQSSGRKT